MSYNKMIFWDQDDTVLRRPIGKNPMQINSTAKRTLANFAALGFGQYFLSAKCTEATEGHARNASLDQYFAGYFDSRKYGGKKSLATPLEQLGITANQARESAIYIGNNVDHDVVADVPGLVHILDPLAIERDFQVYEEIVGTLERTWSNDFSKAFETLWKINQSRTISGVNLLFVKEKLPRDIRDQVGIPDFSSYLIQVL